MENIDLSIYKIYTLNDCNDSNVMYGAIALNNKHTVRDFQNEINRVKEQFEDDIAQYGDDWSIISQNINESFDWFEIDIDTEDYLTF